MLQKLEATLTIAGKTRSQAAQLARLVSAALSRQTGVWGGIVVRGCTNTSATQDAVSEASNAERTGDRGEQTDKSHAFQREL